LNDLRPKEVKDQEKVRKAQRLEERRTKQL